MAAVTLLVVGKSSLGFSFVANWVVNVRNADRILLNLDIQLLRKKMYKATSEMRTTPVMVTI